MLIEIAGWAAPQGGVITSCMAGPRAFLLLVFLLVGALLVLYGKTIFYSGSWKATVSSAPMVAWLLTKVESEPVKALEKVTVEKLAKDHRLKLDSAAARRLSRSVFLRDHKEFDCNVPPVSVVSLFLSFPRFVQHPQLDWFSFPKANCSWLHVLIPFLCLTIWKYRERAQARPLSLSLSFSVERNLSSVLSSLVRGAWYHAQRDIKQVLG